MHEMSIAEGILNIALDVLKEHKGTVIHVVQLELGTMSGVEPEALLFCWEALTKGTPAESSRIEIRKIPVQAQCLDCDRQFEVDRYRFICPACGSHFVQVLSGREMQVTSVDID